MPHTFEDGSTKPVNLNYATIPPAMGKSSGNVTEKILVDDTTGTYYCATCGYAGAYQSVFGHRKAHAVKAPASPADQLAALEAQMVDLRNSLTKQQAKPKPKAPAKVDASWKTRALKAEKQLATLRSALGVVDS